VGGKAIPLYVEVLVVADYSAYLDHQTFAASTDPTTVLQQMRVYYAHLISGVGDRFRNSFASDPDLNLVITVKNFLIASTLNSGWQWSDPAYVGDSKLNILYDKTALASFSSFLAGQIPYQFDVAFGFFEYALFFLKKLINKI
jgi:hypothetical protein